MAASIIPPPILQSTHASAPRPVVQSAIIARDAPLQDRQSELEADLQFLLDAQSEGLVRGLEGGMVDDHASTGSTTPTAQSVRSTSTRRTAKPKKKPGLRGSRKGIYAAILALSNIKDEELQGIDGDIRDKDKTLKQIDEWEQKKAGLQEATKNVESNEETVRVQRLQQQADTLQEEINRVELQLSDLKARHRKLVRQATAVENSVQAKMASYTSSLRILDEDVQKFLALKPPEGSVMPSSREGETSIWELPAKRRTLQMARESWLETKESLTLQRRDMLYEKEALDEGAIVWKDVVTKVTDFERRLRVEMAKLPAQADQSVVPAPSNSDHSQQLRDLIGEMRTLVETLEMHFEQAQERNWNLLIAAIGAELEAIRKGQEMLEGVLRATEGESEDLVDRSADAKQPPDPGDEIRKLDESFETARRRMSNGAESEDDPDPELLFSKHDTDTE